MRLRMCRRLNLMRRQLRTLRELLALNPRSLKTTTQMLENIFEYKAFRSAISNVCFTTFYQNILDEKVAANTNRKRLEHRIQRRCFL